MPYKRTKRRHRKKGRRPKFISIYCITCKTTRRYYIGSSKDTFIRWNNHFWKLYKSKHTNKQLLDDFNKYGITNFSFRILHLVELPITSYKLRKIEQLFINRYKTNTIYNVYKASR